MKTEIDEKGLLTITATTPTESYALKQWFDKFVLGEEGESCLQIMTLDMVKQKVLKENESSGYHGK